MFRIRILLVCMCLVLVTGCAGQSVSHLPRGEGQSGAINTLNMRYLSFQYQVIPLDGEIGVVAEAFPQVDHLPDWASWYDEVCIFIYVSNREGKLLASTENVLVPRALNREGGLQVEARFDLGTARDQPLFISFGYRLMLADAPSQNGVTTSDRNKTTPTGRRTLVAEGALEK